MQPYFNVSREKSNQLGPFNYENDCILESGFLSATTFYRTFKNEFGCSPKEYIRKIDTTK